VQGARTPHRATDQQQSTLVVAQGTDVAPAQQKACAARQKNLAHIS